MKVVIGKYLIDNFDDNGHVNSGVWLDTEDYKLRKPLKVFGEYTSAVSYVRKLDESEKKRLAYLYDRYDIEKMFDDANTLMLKQFNERELHSVLKEAISKLREKKAVSCSKWRDSGDRGACFAYEVAPIDNVMSEVEKIENKIKEVNQARNFYHLDF